MAVEAIAAVAAKEVAVVAAKEAAIHAAREIAQKAAMEAVGTSGRSEIQTAMLERQTMQEGFRIGEMPETKGEGREVLKEKETAAAEELRGKLEGKSRQLEGENFSDIDLEKNTQSTEVLKEKEDDVPKFDEEIKEYDLEELKRDYANDIRSRSENSEDIDVEEITNTELKKVSSEELRIKRLDFNSNKDGLRKQWEEDHGRSWPVYENDVYYKDNLIRRQGDYLDAHHKIPLEFGGENTADNITPMHALEHFDKQGVHAADSPFSKLENYLKKEVA